MPSSGRKALGRPPTHVRAKIQAERRRQRARIVWIAVPIVLVLAGAATAGVLLTSSSGPASTQKPHLARQIVSVPPPPPVAPSPVVPPGGPLPRSALYGTTASSGNIALKRMNLATGRSGTIFEGGDLKVPPEGDWFAYSTYVMPSGKEVRIHEKGAVAAVVHMRDLRTGRDIKLGKATGVVWSYDGMKLAALAPDHSVLAATVADPRFRQVAPPGDWTILGWAGDRIVAFRTPPLADFFISLSGGISPSPTPDATLRDPSPDGRWLFGISHHGDAVFQLLAGGPPVVVDIHPWTLGLSYWTKDDLVYAAAATSTAVNAPSAVLVLNPRNGSMYRVPGTSGAVGAYPASKAGDFLLVKGKTGIHRIWRCLPNGHCRFSGRTPLGADIVRAT